MGRLTEERCERGQLCAGVARVNITPSVGIEMAGYVRQSGSQGVMDELSATVVVLEVGTTRVALVSCDLLYTCEDLVAAVRCQAEEQTGIPGTHLLLAATHTHSGPACGGRWEGGVMSRKYRANLACLLAGAVTEACSQMQPARVASGQGQVDANVNRRMRLPNGFMALGENPGGPVDSSVGVTRIDDLEGNPLALIVNYAAHPVCLRPSNLLLSADWVGFMRRPLEAFLGAPVLFLQGASGNVNPVKRGTQSMAERVGLRVAGEVLKVFSALQTTARYRLEGDLRDHDHRREALVVAGEPSSTTCLGICQQIVGMPLFPPLSLQETEQVVARWAETLSAASDGEAETGQISAAGFYHEWFLSELSALKAEGRAPTFPAEMQAIRIGDAAVLTFPAEVFTEIGLEIKEHSPFPVTLFVSCANGCSLPYVPTEEAFARGGYEVDRAQDGGAMPSGLAPTAAETIVKRGVGLLDGLWGRS